MARLKLLGAVVLLLAWPETPVAAEPLEQWAPYVAEASLRFGLPQDWIWRVMEIESAGHPIVRGRPVVSSAGAMGLMQLMPGTWSDMRMMLGLGANPFEARDNILAGSAYLKLMYDRFGYPGLFAAYNAGPARYALVLKGRARLGFETRDYVVRAAGPRSVPVPSVPHRRPSLFALVGAESASFATPQTEVVRARAPATLFALTRRTAP